MNEIKLQTDDHFSNFSLDLNFFIIFFTYLHVKNFKTTRTGSYIFEGVSSADIKKQCYFALLLAVISSVLGCLVRILLCHIVTHWVFYCHVFPGIW